MKLARVPILLGLCLCAAAGLADARDTLTLTASESSAQLAPRERGPQQISLPSLEFSLRATIACPPGADVESVTVSVADIHRRFSPGDISDKAALDVSISVPANQVAPVTVADFCVRGQSGEKKTLLIPGVATAQASLRCRGEKESSVHFKSAVLPIRLLCVADEGQESSTDR